VTNLAFWDSAASDQVLELQEAIYYIVGGGVHGLGDSYTIPL
jgi:hypothetical protein